MADLQWKIMHVPSGLYVSASDNKWYWENYPEEYKRWLNKKGRYWKRKADVLIAWRTMLKYKLPMSEYIIQEYELTPVRNIEQSEIGEAFEKSDLKYNIRKIESEIRSIEYRIEYAEKNISEQADLLPELNKTLESLKKKLKK